MPVTIRHPLTATTPDNLSAEIRPSHWNQDHIATVSLNQNEVIKYIAAGTTSRSSGVVSFANSNGVSFGLASDGRITASVAAGGGGGAGIQSVIAGANTVSGGAVSFSNANGLSFGLAGSTMTASHNGISALRVSAGSTFSNVTALNFSNANGISFGFSGGAVTASAAGGGGGPVNAVDVVYDNTDSGLTATNAKAAIDELAEDLAGVPVLIRRRYLIRAGIDGIVGGTVDDAQATVNLAAMQATVDAADANSAGVEMDQDTIQIFGGPLIVRSSAGGMIWDSPTFARLEQRSNNVGILQLGDTASICQNLDFSGINLHYVNDQFGNSSALACVIYNQWKSRIGKIQIASTITSARPYAGFVFPQSQTVFSCVFHNLFSFQAHQYLMYISNFGTGNVFQNIYLSGVGTGGTAQIVAMPFLWQMVSGSQMHDSDWSQINIEWCNSNVLARINNVRGPIFKSWHIEQNILSGASAAMINNVISNIQLNSLQILDMRIQDANITDTQPSVHKAFNNGRTNIDTFCWVNNVSSYVDMNWYMNWQADSDGITTNTAYVQIRSGRLVDSGGTVLRDNMRVDRRLGGTDMDGAAWGNMDIEGWTEMDIGGSMSRLKGGALRVTTATKTLYGQYLHDAPTITVPGAPGFDMAITLSDRMAPPGARWANLEIRDGATISFQRGGTTVNNVAIINHDGTPIYTIPAGQPTGQYHFRKVAGDWVVA